MPSDFPEVWEKRVERNLTTADVAEWLDGIAELDAPVTELGAGSASESNVINIPTTDFEPNVLVNNTTYPIALQEYDDDNVIVKLDKLQTEVTTLSDDQIVGASYEKIDVVTGSHTTAINSTKYRKAAHAIAPVSHTAATPVLETTGADNVVLGRKIFTYEDLVAQKNAADKAEMPVEDRRAVLCTDHYNDLLLDRKNFGDQLVNYKTGQPAPVIAGWKIYQYIGNPTYNGTTKTKKAWGAVAAGTDVSASFFFYAKNIAKKTGLTKQYFNEAKNDPESQTNKLNYRHYFIAIPKRLKYIAATLSKAVS